MKKLVVLALVIVAGYGLIQDRGFSPFSPVSTGSNNQILADAQSRQLSDVQLTGQGTVIRILSDDLEGSRHQRFILDVGTGKTVLVSHNIDLAPRVENLSAGDRVEFTGEFEWNAKGGVVHLTHHDPAGRHPGGWIKHQGRIYQ